MMLNRFLPLAAILAASSVTNAQLAESSGYLSLVDGHITLNGTFKQLAGIEATSVGGYLCVSIGLGDDAPLFGTTPSCFTVPEPSATPLATIGVLVLVSLLGRHRGSISDPAGRGSKPHARLETGLLSKGFINLMAAYGVFI